MSNTTVDEVIESFESSFADKHIIPKELEMVWLKRSIGRYSLEFEDLNLNEESETFDKELPRYVIDTLAELMHQYYNERQLSLVNKRVSIVTKEVSIDGNNGSKTSTLNELNEIKENVADMINKQKKTIYV